MDLTNNGVVFSSASMTTNNNNHNNSNTTIPTTTTTTHTLPRRCVRLREERPHSLYDNIGDEVGRSAAGGGNTSNFTSVNDDPTGQQHSLTAGMVTTVPQNLAAPKIEGRHIPTRSSLRHSRMIVLNKQGKVPRKYLPHVVHRHKLGTSVLILQVLVGIAITTLAAWLLLWAPNLPLTDIPYWSGLPVLFSAFIGLMLLCWCRREYPGMPVRYHVCAFRIFSILASLLAGISSFCAGGFALSHLIRLYNGISSCQPAHSLDSTCICRTHEHYNVTYTDLSCPEVWNILTVLLIASTAANMLAGVLASIYIYLHWTTGRNKPYYTRVNQPLFITNKL